MKPENKKVFDELCHEADLCKNEGAEDVANLLVDAASTIKRLDKQVTERGLPLAWKRKSNGKLYGLVGVHVMFGRPMIWLYEDGTNKARHLPLHSLGRLYMPFEITQK